MKSFIKQVSMGNRMNKKMVWSIGLILTTGLLHQTAWAVFEVSRLTLGRTTNPEKSLVIETDTTYAATNWADPSQDTLQGTYSVAYGVTDRLTAESELATQESQRNRLRADRLAMEAIYRILDNPFQWAPLLELRPSLQGESFESVYGFRAIKNIRQFSLILNYEGTLGKESEDSVYKLKDHEVEPGILYRFGLHGLLGLDYDYHKTGSQAIDVSLGGSVSRNVFLGVEQSFGLTQAAPDYQFGLHVDFYFGPYALGGWGL